MNEYRAKKTAGKAASVGILATLAGVAASALAGLAAAHGVPVDPLWIAPVLLAGLEGARNFFKHRFGGR